VIATGFDQSRPLKRIDQPMYKRQVEQRPVERPTTAVAPQAPAATRGHEEKKFDPNDLEVPSFLRRR
jgi:hypothetical protein